VVNGAITLEFSGAVLVRAIAQIFVHIPVIWSWQLTARAFVRSHPTHAWSLRFAASFLGVAFMCGLGAKVPRKMQSAP
jgi:ABC-type Na+ efflux pump permease subunit